MQDTSEHDLVDGLRSGQAAAWHALYDAYAERIWRFVARSMGAGSADVADVVQETLMAAARSAAGYDPARGSLWFWLCGIARNHVALNFRKQGRYEQVKQVVEQSALGNGQLSRRLEGREPSPIEALEAAELATQVRAALAELPAEYETLLAARYLEDISVEQLALEDRSTATAIRSKLARARRAFREVYERMTRSDTEQK